MRFDRVYNGAIVDLTERRLVFRRNRHAPPWLALLAIGVLYVLMIRGSLAASASLPTTFTIFAISASVTIAWIVNLHFFTALPLTALEWSFMPQVRRSLVIEREDAGDFRESPAFRVTIDGDRLGPTLRRALFEIRYNQLTSHVLVIGERAMTLNACLWPELVDRSFEVERTTRAILACDDRIRDDYDAHSLMPLVQASIRVLALGPERLGAFDAPRGRAPRPARGGRVKSLHEVSNRPTFHYLDGQPASIQRLSCESGWQADKAEELLRVGISFVPSAWHVALLFLVPKLALGLGPWPLSFAWAAASFVPSAALLYIVAYWLYVKPLNDRAKEMIKATPA